MTVPAALTPAAVAAERKPGALLAPSARGAGAEGFVRISHLSKSFAGRRGLRSLLRAPRATTRVPVLRDLSCDIREGEFFGLLGPNGAGKTTLFKTLATLVLPDSGQVTVAGHDVVSEPDRVREVLAPVIADERSLNWRLSAFENLRLYATLYGIRLDRVRRVDEVLDIVGLTEARDRLVGQFSSGMKQRLLIARALLARPRVLLLDEPTRSLDPVSARAFRTFLRDEVSSAAGCTVLLATHTAEEALGLCDRVGVLHRGRLLAVGPAATLAREYGDDRYRVWTSDPRHPAWDALCARGALAQMAIAAEREDEWSVIEADLPGGYVGAAAVMGALADAGVRVARFERLGLPLAELIERIVQRHGEAPNA